MKKKRSLLDYRNDTELKALKEWTYSQLYHEPTRDDWSGLEYLENDEQFRKDWNDYKTRQRVVKAAKAKDIKELERLTADDPALRELGYRTLTYKHSRGTEKGARHSNYLSDRERFILDWAALDVKRIKQIWKQHFGKMSRTSLAIEIAAELANVSPKQLTSHLKNQARNLAS
jgi:hypothetical protein